jgi:hypothetical protein
MKAVEEEEDAAVDGASIKPCQKEPRVHPKAKLSACYL